MKNSLLICSSIFIFTFFSLHLQARTWTSATGQTIEAEFLSADATNVTIKRFDGKKYVFPLSKLSQADQDFVREKLKSMPPEKPEFTGGNRPLTKPIELNIDTSKPWEPEKQNIASAVRGAREKKVEDLVEPVHATRFGGEDNIIWAPNPDGKTWDVIPYYYPGYGAASTLAIIDLGSGETKVENYPKGTNWHLCDRAIAPNGKVYISVMRGPRVGICIYDPATNEMQVNAIPTPEHMKGETHPLIRSTDGMIFAGGGHKDKSAACIMINPEDNSVTDFGSCGPAHTPNNAFNYYMGADDTHVYIASGKVPWYLVAVDRQTKQSTVLAKTASNGGLINVHQKVHGVTASVRVGDGTKRQDYWCYQGKLFPHKDKCPWIESGIDVEKNLPPKPEIYTERVLPSAKGTKGELWVKTNVPNVSPDPKFPGWSSFKYDVPLYSMGSHRLSELPDGRIFGTAGAYTGNYIFDPATGESSYLGAISLSHYASVLQGNKLWMSGYPVSKLYAYDLSKPWNFSTTGAGPGTKLLDVESPESNPQMVGRFAESGCHKMYNGTTGASGDLYFGGRWMRDGNGGGLGWWGPNSTKDAGMSEPFSAQRINFIDATGKGKYIVLSTSPVVDTVLKKPTPKEGKIFIFDDATKKVINEITVEPGIKGPGPIVGAGGNRVMGWAPDASGQGSFLYGLDAEKGEIVWRQPVPFKLPIEIGGNQDERFDFRLGPDGKIWTFMGDTGNILVRIDPQTAKVDPVAEVGKGGRLAFSGADVYLSGTTFLRRIKGVIEN